MQAKKTKFHFSFQETDVEGKYIDIPNGKGFLQLNMFMQQITNPEKETAEKQANRLLYELLMRFELAKKHNEPPPKIGLLYGASNIQAEAMHAFNALPDKYELKEGETQDGLPVYDPETTLQSVLGTLTTAHGQRAVFRHLLRLIDEKIKLRELKPDDILVYPISTSMEGGASPDIEKDGRVVTRGGNVVSKNILNRDLASVQAGVDDGREMYCPPRPEKKDEYAIGGGTIFFYDPKIASVETSDHRKISQNKYVQEVLGKIARYEKVDLPFTAPQKKQATKKPVKANVQAPMVAYHPGLPSVEAAAQNYDQIYSHHLPVKLTIGVNSGESDDQGSNNESDEQGANDMHIISWNVMAKDTSNGFAKGRSEYGETSQQKTARYRRIAKALRHFVENDTIDFITLQGIRADDANAVQLMYDDISEFFLMATDPDIKLDVVTFYNKALYKPVDRTKVASQLNGEINCFKTCDTEGEIDLFEIVNVLAPVSLPMSKFESYIKSFFKKTLMWTEQKLDITLKIIVGDFNKTVHPYKKNPVPVNKVTSVTSELKRNNQGQGAGAGDGGFMLVGNEIYQIDMEPLNPASGTAFTEAELAPLQTTTMCKMQRQEILRGRAIPSLDQRVIDKVWFNGLTLQEMAQKWTAYNKSLYANGSADAGKIYLREAVNLQNQSGLALTLTSPVLIQQLMACAKPHFFTIDTQHQDGKEVYTITASARHVEQFCQLVESLKKRYEMVNYIDQQFNSYLNRGLVASTFKGPRTVDKTQANHYESILINKVKAGKILIAMLETAREEDDYLTNKFTHQPGSFKLRLDNIRYKLGTAYPDLMAFADILIKYRNVNPEFVYSYAHDIQRIVLAHPQNLMQLVWNYLPDLSEQSAMERKKEQKGVEVKALTTNEKEFLRYLKNELLTYVFDKTLPADNKPLTALLDVCCQYTWLNNQSTSAYEHNVKEMRYKKLAARYESIIKKSPVPSLLENIARYLDNNRTKYPSLVQKYTHEFEFILSTEENQEVMLKRMNDYLLDDAFEIDPIFISGFLQMLNFIPLKDPFLVEFMCNSEQKNYNLVNQYFAILTPLMQQVEDILKTGPLENNAADFNKIVNYFKDDPELKRSRDPFLLQLSQVWEAALGRIRNTYTAPVAQSVDELENIVLQNDEDDPDAWVELRPYS